MKEFPFLGPAYAGRSESNSSQRLVNMYLEKGHGKPWVLIGTPGCYGPQLILSDAYSGIRGAIRLNENISIWVCGSTVYKVLADLSSSSMGTIAYEFAPVSMAYDGTNILVCSAGNLYAFTTASTSSTLIRTNVSSVDFIDGYFILTEMSTGRFYVSNQYSTTIDALDFATAEGAPDNLVRVLVNNREAILFGVETTEFWYVSGNADFPMSRVQGTFIEEGLIAKDSAVKCGPTVAWLGASKDGDSTVWMLNGYRPTPISNPAIANRISRWDRKDDAVAFYYKQEDHAFYVLTSPSASETLVYDFNTQQWHERAWLDGSGNLQRIRPNVHCYFAGKTLVGDWQSGYIYEYDLDFFQDATLTGTSYIPRIRTTQMVQSALNTRRNGTLRLDMDTGVGNGFTNGEDPKASLRWSKDGGHTWGASLLRSFGRVGEFGKMVEWHRVGCGERVVYEVTITDPVKVCITGAYFE